MNVRTQETILAEYMEYKAAQTRILATGQEYTIKDRSLKRADLALIKQTITDLANELLKLEVGGRIRVKKVVIDYDT